MTTQETPSALTIAPRARRRAIVSSVIGNGLEWFDFGIFSSFSIIISRLMFPPQSGTAMLMVAFATFGIAFVVRPVGGVLFGMYADRAGRKAALSAIILMMSAGTLLIGLTPSYATIGVAASVMIVAARMLQGFSAGGEFGTATAFLIETAPNKKVYYSSWQVASQGASMMLASGFGYFLTTGLSPEALESWGWRVPFFVGLLIGPVGLYIRARLEETEEFTAAEKEKFPLGTLFKLHYGRLLAGVAVNGVATISVYLILFMPTFAVNNLGIPGDAAFLGGIAAGVITLFGVPFVGHLADRIGPARVMTYAAVAAFVLAYPLFKLMTSTPTVGVMVVVIALLGVIMSFYFGPLPALLSGLFPAAIRGSGLSVAYNVGVTLLGGIAPLVLTWLLKATGSLDAPSIYYMAIAVISLVGLFFVRKRYAQR